MSASLNVTYGDQSLGSLSLDKDSGLPRLTYDAEWQTHGFAITPALTLDNQHAKASAYHYLDNLLPEGKARSLLASNLGVSESNIYPQIIELGQDLSGAIRFSYIGKSDDAKRHFEVMSELELIQRLEHKEEVGLLHWKDKPRLSVAGVQHKINVFMQPSGEFGFGDGSLCSTHILKFERADCPYLVLNEFFCMKLSSAVGLDTAQVQFRRFGEHPALMVERFDRKYDANSDRVLRRHVIDACQALDIPRDSKYERNLGDGRDVKHIREGVSLPKLFAFSEAMTSPIESVQWLLRWQIFNLIISNYDSHGKNISYFFDQNGARFTPTYDLVNVSMFPEFKQALSMAMGDEFDPETMNAYQFADFAETCQLNKGLVARNLTYLGQRTLTVLENGALIDALSKSNAFHHNEIEYLHALSHNIVKRAQHFMTQAPSIKSFSAD